MADLPEIRHFADAVTLGIGQEVSVFVNKNHPNFGPVRVSTHEMVDEVIDDVFAQQKIPRDRSLEQICALIARVSVGRLATSQGFSVERGPLLQPYEIVSVELRPEDVQIKEVTATRSPTGL